MNTIYNNLPVQMYSCFDTDGRITPFKFKFKNPYTSEIITISISEIKQRHIDRISASFLCVCSSADGSTSFTLRYHFADHRWYVGSIRL